MRILTLSVLGFCFLFHPGLAQKNKFEKFRSNSDYKSGSVQLSDSSWQVGLIKDKVKIERYNRITFIDSLGKKSVFKPSNLIGYRLDNKRFKADAKSNHFYERLRRGRLLSIYQMEFKPTASEEYSVNSSGKLVTNSGYENLGTFQYFYKELSGTFQEIPQEGDFHTPLADFFKDCPSLSKKLLNKEYNTSDIQKIMNTYNFQCQL